MQHKWRKLLTLVVFGLFTPRYSNFSLLYNFVDVTYSMTGDYNYSQDFERQETCYFSSLFKLHLTNRQHPDLACTKYQACSKKSEKSKEIESSLQTVFGITSVVPVSFIRCRKDYRMKEKHQMGKATGPVGAGHQNEKLTLPSSSRSFHTAIISADCAMNHPDKAWKPKPKICKFSTG